MERKKRKALSFSFPDNNKGEKMNHRPDFFLAGEVWRGKGKGEENWILPPLF